MVPTHKLKFVKQGARCDICPNKNEILVPPSPYLPPKTPDKGPIGVIVGEAPGRSEEKLGRPFVGMSGGELDGYLKEEVGNISRAKFHLTNAALCRNDNDKLNDRAAECCAPRLLSELKNLPPTAPIVAAGRNAATSILGTGGILSNNRGFVWVMPGPETWRIDKLRKTALKYPPHSEPRHDADLALETALGRAELEDRVVLPTLHPAFVLRSRLWTPVIRIDFRRLHRILTGATNPRALEDKGDHKVTTNVRDLYRLGGKISLDIETTETGSPLTAELLCVGVSDGPTTRVLWPWKPRMAKPLSDFLRGRLEVVGHNLMNFDKVVLERYGVR